MGGKEINKTGREKKCWEYHRRSFSKEKREQKVICVDLHVVVSFLLYLSCSFLPHFNFFTPICSFLSPTPKVVGRNKYLPLPPPSSSPLTPPPIPCSLLLLLVIFLRYILCICVTSGGETGVGKERVVLGRLL